MSVIVFNASMRGTKNMCRLHWDVLVGLVSAILSLGASAQFVGKFSLSKTTYLAGEPVFLVFTVQNVSNKPLLIRTANPLSFCGGYQFKLTGARDREANGCGPAGAGGSCASGSEILEPGRSRTDRILLNARYDLGQPGIYPLHVTYRLDYDSANEGSAALGIGGIFEDFHDQLEIVIEPSRPDDLKPEFEQFARDLDSKDVHTRLEAAKVIGYLAPRFMEPTILNMLDSPILEGYGVEGLRNLGTSSAHQALRRFVKDTPPTNVVGAYQKAIRYLGEIGDPGDISVLLNAASKNAPDSYSRTLAIAAAGLAGGDVAVPALITELKDPSIDTQQDAVRALYLTGSKSAVPVLISLLPSPNWRVSLTAEYGLEVLTHRSGASTKAMNPPPPDTYSKWIRWWNIYGQNATIFKLGQCGKITPLPSQ